MFLHTSDWLWYIGGSIFYSLTKSHLSHSRFWLQQGRNPSPNYRTNFLMKPTTYDPFHSPKKEERSKQMCHITVFIFNIIIFFLNPFWVFNIFFKFQELVSSFLGFSGPPTFLRREMSHPGDADWEVPEDSIQPALGSGDVTGGLRGQVTGGEVVVRAALAGGTGRDVFSRVIYPGLWRTTPKMVSGTHTDPYYSHIFRDSYGSGMGTVWGPRGAGLSGPLRVHEMRMEKVFKTQFPSNGHDFTMVETYDKKNPENQSKFFGIRFWGMKHKDL